MNKPPPKAPAPKAPLPNFRGHRALVLHRADASTQTLTPQLESLGLAVERRWPAEGVAERDVDLIFFDSDLGFDGLFDWPTGEPPVPLIALMGSEAPGRIEWTLAQAPAAYLIKPIGSTGVFSTLAIAVQTFETRRALGQRADDLERRMKARPLVFKALLQVMERFGVDDDEAFRLLRREAMNQRLSIEELSLQIAKRERASPLRARST